MAMSEEQSSYNPFRPGTGSVPEHLTGREPEQALLRQALQDITGPRKGDYGPLLGWAPQPLKIVGPRGVGKTALLGWTKSVVNPKDADVVSLDDLPNSDSGERFSEFLSELAHIPGWDPQQHVESQALKYLQMALNWRPGQPSVLGFRQILQERLQVRPLLLLLDEVMHYDADMLGKLLRHGQTLMRDRWPLAIVLAGTPALNEHLKKVDATFINRAKNIHINGLHPDATRDALIKPFADHGVAVTDEALKLMLSWTDDYPYFTQIVGSEVWDAKKGAAEVDVDLVRSVEQAVHDQRNLFYASIYSLIDDDDELLEGAMKAVEAIEAAPQPLTPRQVRTRIAEGAGLSSKDAREAFNQLLDIGLFWVTGDVEVHAAIPSFFNYFKKIYGREHA